MQQWSVEDLRCKVFLLILVSRRPSFVEEDSYFIVMLTHDHSKHKITSFHECEAIGSKDILK